MRNVQILRFVVWIQLLILSFYFLQQSRCQGHVCMVSAVNARYWYLFSIRPLLIKRITCIAKLRLIFKTKMKFFIMVEWTTIAIGEYACCDPEITRKEILQYLICCTHSFIMPDICMVSAQVTPPSRQWYAYYLFVILSITVVWRCTMEALSAEIIALG